MTVGTVTEDTVSVETTGALVEIAIEEMITTGKLKNFNTIQPYVDIWVYSFAKNSNFYLSSLKHLYYLQG